MYTFHGMGMIVALKNGMFTMENITRKKIENTDLSAAIIINSLFILGM